MNTIAEDCIALGLGGAEVVELRRAEPWVNSSASRHDKGEQHLREWLAAGRPVAARSAIDVQGDPEIVAMVRDVIAKLPEPVAWRLRNVQIRCGAAHCEHAPGRRGYCDATRDPLLVGIIVGDEATVAHELGHAWTMEPNPLFVGVPGEKRELLHDAVAELTVETGRVDAVVDSEMLDEYAADALATLWLGRRVDTTTGRRGLRRRARMRAEIERRAAAIAERAK